MKKFTAISGIMGNALEWYDFLLYAYFASLLAPLFFPNKSAFLSLLMMLGVFAVGFLARPLGAIVIGNFGDKYGRKKALVFSITIMTLATACVGLLPTYSSIGYLAPFLLVSIRCLQGFAVAGEVGTATSFLVEHASKNRRGLMGSFVVANAWLGILLAALVITLVTNFVPKNMLDSWAWRLPFLLVVPFGIVGLIIRLHTTESPQFLAIKNIHVNPIKTILVNYPTVLFRAILLTAITAISDYLLIGYFTIYLSNTKGLQLKDAMLINTISICVFLFFIPLFGFLSDRFGRKKIFSGGLLSLMVFIFPIFFLLSYKTFFLSLIAEILFVVILAAMDGVILTMLAELFPTEIRNTGLTLSYNIALALFGGTAPFIATALVHATHLSLAPAMYSIFAAAIALISIFFFKETYRLPL
jgi:proline/betaine transport protein TphA